MDLTFKILARLGFSSTLVKVFGKVYPPFPTCLMPIIAQEKLWEIKSFLYQKCTFYEQTWFKNRILDIKSHFIFLLFLMANVIFKTFQNQENILVLQGVNLSNFENGAGSGVLLHSPFLATPLLPN